MIPVTLRKLALAILLSGIISGCGPDADMSSKAHANRAQQLLDEGKLKPAILEIKNALRTEPTDAELRWLAGTIYLEAGENAAAEKEFAKAIELGIHNVDSELSLVRSWVAQGKLKEGLDYFGAKELSSLSLEAKVLYAEILLASGEVSQAEELLEAVLKESPDLVEALLVLARLEIGRRNLLIAKRLVDEIIHQEAENPFANLIAGELAVAQEELDKAGDFFAIAEQDSRTKTLAKLGLARIALIRLDYPLGHSITRSILEEFPNLPIARYLKGLLYFQQGEHENAINELENVIAVIPKHTASQLLLGKIYLDNNQLERANQALSTVVNSDPEHLSGTQLLATTKLRLGQPEEALSLLGEVNADSNDALSLVVAGSAYIALGQTSRGAVLLEKATAIIDDPSLLRGPLARAHIATGDFDTAVSELRTLIQSGTQGPETHLLLAFAQISKGDLAGAYAVTEELKQAGFNVFAANLLGAIELRQNNLDEAKSHFISALKEDPAFIPALMNLGRIELAQNALEQAQTHFGSVFEIDPNHPDAALALTEILVREDRVDDAIELLREFSDNNQSPRALVVLAQLLSQKGNSDEALQFATRANTLSPTAPDTAIALALIQNGLELSNEALTTLLKVPEQRRDRQFNLAIAQSARVANRLSLARRTLSSLIEESPTEVTPYVNLISLELAEGDILAAQKVLSSLPEATTGYNTLYPTLVGDIHRSAGRYELALEYYQKAFQEGASAKLLHAIAGALLKLDRENETISILEEWLSEHSDDVSTRLLLANQLMLQGDSGGAIGHYEEALKYSDSHPLALNNLAWLYHQEGNAQSTTVAKKLLSLGIESGDILDTAGWIILNEGDIEQGLRIISRAHNLEPGSADITYHLAVALQRNEKYREASEVITNFLKTHPEHSNRPEFEAILKDND